MEKKEIRVGIVGYGWVAGAHLKALNAIDGCAVAAICSRRALDTGVLRQQYNSPISVYSDFNKMLADKTLDVISICTPHHLHADQAVAAATAGKHLILEKPAALLLDDINRIERTVKKSGVRAIVCFEGRSHGLALVIRDFISKGFIGHIHYAEVDYFHGIGPWYKQYAWNVKKAMGGSSLLTAGCHALHGLLWIMGAKPVEVMSYGTKSENPDFQPYEYPTSTVSILKFENGAVGKCASVIDCVQPYEGQIRLVGSKGSILNDGFHTTEIHGLDKSGWSKFNTLVGRSGDVMDHPYVTLFSDFISAVRHERPPMFDFTESLFSHRVCLAADHALETGKPVKISDFVSD